MQHEVYPYNTWDTEPYQSWAGALDLAYRLFLLFYLLFELRQVYLTENSRIKLNLYRFFIVFFLTWFCYLPLIVIIAVGVNPVLRSTVINTVRLLFDLLATAIMMLLFVPRWAGAYFQFYNTDFYISLHLPSINKAVQMYGSHLDATSPVATDDPSWKPDDTLIRIEEKAESESPPPPPGGAGSDEDMSEEEEDTPLESHHF